MADWKKRNRPLCLEKRFEFESYEQTRDFLDRLSEISEQKKRFPDISFGKTYVNLTLRPEEENDSNKDICNDDYKFATEIDELLS
tara:strand:+ start:182 stop:436 length:255 start_codon:yes stop_codon:yes gene_type:complete